ncbi:MAG: serine/threonine-protein kinase [Gammaproteobacteria bacterium]|nr:serine/threonine-protein kinase [Gammaproteobacteria bacterium]
MRELKSGTQLANRYTIVRKLGAGATAETWLANDRLTGTSVVLKISVNPDLDAEILRREWQLSIRLVHAHIVRVFEFHDDADGAFYSQQFIDGPDISVLCGATLENVLAPVALIADALRYAHGKELVHRDIKSSNILLDANGAPYLIDFGVAATPTDPVGGGSLIAASPQQLDGDVAMPADDIFALGGLVYELVSGRSPYSSANTAADIRSRVPPPVTAADGSVIPASIQQLVASMLDKDASRRPDAATVIAALRDAGVQPGPAPSHLVGGVRAVGDEVIESDSKIRRARGHATPAAVDVVADRSGLSARVVGISLSVLVLLLLGVIFLLPKSITQNGVEPHIDAGTASDTVEQSADSAAASDDTVEPPQRDERVQTREAAEVVLGRLLAKTRTLEGRAVQRWGGLPWKRGEEAYKAGDAAYLARDYETAAKKYAEAIEHVDPLLEQVDAVFRTTLADAEQALENADALEAVRLYELAVAISPNHARAKAGLLRAQNLDTVLALTEQGLALERELELDAARQSFEQAIEVDPEWRVAADGLERVLGTINQMQFDSRMTEGLMALADGDYLTARAAFRRAQELKPGSPDPADGLLQVDQGVRLNNIAVLKREAQSLEAGERWQTATDAYQSILELDSNLTFAHEGVARATRMEQLHQTLQGYIDDPDVLSSPRTMQNATQLVVDITRMPDIGPRLASQRDELSRLLKRAATPLTVQLVSDNVTDVSIYKVGKLGAFGTTELSLRPGTYVAVGSRPGYRDVRLEFRVAPEIDMQPVVVRCEEAI